MAGSDRAWRAAGLLLHPSSLFSPYGIGDLGPSAQALAAFMAKAGLNFWQLLPLSPTSPALGNSPYSAYSAFGGHSLLISPDLLVRDGWLREHEAAAASLAPAERVDYPEVERRKNALFDLAFERAESRLEGHEKFQSFLWDNGTWLNDLAFFTAAKARFGGLAWTQWPAELKWRDEAALRRWGRELARPILREKFVQYLFFSQLGELKALFRDCGLGFIGDAAIYVNHDSSDVWAQPHLFELNQDGQPEVVAGVPPDYFAQDGQLWGNPLFKWEAHRREGFQWWKSRLHHNLGLYDWLRLDHFRAFAAYWEVPAGAETAAAGRWRPGPGRELFEAAGGSELRIIAEDLGLITPDVTELRCGLGYPGMRVLHFAFGSPWGLSCHLPYRVEPDNALYTATHDNNTSRGWYRLEADSAVRARLSDLAGFEVSETSAAWALIRLAWLSPASLALTTAQDLLNLDEKARMNMPGQASGHWAWRLSRPDFFTENLAARLAELGALAGRDNLEHPNTLSY